MSWHRKHLLDIESLSPEEIITVLDTARAFKAVGERAIKKVPALRGKTVINLFIEPSTRTRISFELAQRLSALLSQIWGHPVPNGSLDVNLHRDDLDQRVSPNIHPTVIPFDVNGKTVVLVDDVLFSGRTIRAAMDALNDFGRPRRIQLAVLIDRGHRELPIKADFVGKNVPTALTENIRVQLAENGGEDAVHLERK